ncbi:MAG TPA: T9SS type A sorting domain-containing protein, partial [Ignavibacteriaceae bacterium]
RAKWQDEAGFDAIKGTGAWASGYQQFDWNGLQAVVDGPEVDYWVTYDDANMYVSAKVTDQIVTVPNQNRKDGITFFLTPRKYVNGNGIFPSKTLTVNVDSSGAGQAGDDLVALADTGGVEFDLMLDPGTNLGNITDPDNGYYVELKIPFSTFSYPASLGDSVVFIGGLVNDVDIFEDTTSNTHAKTWWFMQQPGQHAPAWVALGPANPSVGVGDPALIPLSIELFDNYPNPFNPSTTIKYSVNVIADVSLSVYNILGQAVSVMNQTNVQPGYNEFKFDGTGLSSGVYLYQLKVKNLNTSQVVNTKVNKMVLLK